MKKLHQNGFSVTHVLLALVIIGLIGFVGWKVWDQSKQDDPTPTPSASTPAPTPEPAPPAAAPDPAQEYTRIKQALTQQSTVCTNTTASFSGSPAGLKVVSPNSTFNPSDNATITTDHDFSYVAFGCEGGSQAVVAVLGKQANDWKILAEGSSYIMPCNKVDNKSIPKAIIHQECYANAAGAVPRPIQN